MCCRKSLLEVSRSKNALRRVGRTRILQFVCILGHTPLLDCIACSIPVTFVEIYQHSKCADTSGGMSGESSFFSHVHLSSLFLSPPVPATQRSMDQAQHSRSLLGIGGVPVYAMGCSEHQGLHRSRNFPGMTPTRRSSPWEFRYRSLRLPRTRLLFKLQCYGGPLEIALQQHQPASSSRTTGRASSDRGAALPHSRQVGVAAF